MSLTADELLAGSALTHEIVLPPALCSGEEGDAVVVIRPLTVRNLQAVAKAARDDAALSSALMIQQALVEPPLTAAQVLQLPAGLAKFLLDRVNELSGLNTSVDDLHKHVQTPLARACFVLAAEFGWTAEEVTSMTIGQILLYLEMRREASANGPT